MKAPSSRSKNRKVTSPLPLCGDLPAALTSELRRAEPLRPSDLKVPSSRVYDTYWRFAAERQAIFFRRVLGAPPPWTADPILAEFKFTNVYRASDRVSQYLISNVAYSGSSTPENVFLRVMLFKVFNSIDTWKALEDKFGEITVDNFDTRLFGSMLLEQRHSGKTIFSGAYIMPSAGRNAVSKNKHDAWLGLLDRMLLDGVPERLAASKTMKAAFALLRSYPMIGDFLAYQYVIDLNYSPLMNFSEDDFVVAGPGARSGLEKCFPGQSHLDTADLIRMMVDRQEAEFERLGISFQSLWGRRLHLIDCQNLFCEVDKYSRVAHPEIFGVGGRSRIKQKFRPSTRVLRYWFPPKWRINNRLPNGASE